MEAINQIQIFELITVIFFAGATWSKINAIHKRLDKFDDHPERLAKIETELKNIRYEKK